MERYEVDTLLVTGASVTLPDGRMIELPDCYVYELADVAWEHIKKLSSIEREEQGNA